MAHRSRSARGRATVLPGFGRSRGPWHTPEQAMSIVSQDRPMIMRDHVNVKCQCGRSLRARLDHAGSTITCWDCHASVSVPVPVAPGDWVARLLRMGARQILEGRTFTLLALGAVLV